MLLAFVAIKELNGFYHTCLDKCKLLKSRGIDTAGAGLDQQFLNNTADKLIYEHAIELVSQGLPFYHLYNLCNLCNSHPPLFHHVLSNQVPSRDIPPFVDNI